MPGLSGKSILIISPQSWGKMFISKHHYAIELARKGNKVFFLNPPDVEGNTKGSYISIVPSNVADGLFFVNHRLWFPYRIKFHALPLFHWLIRFHIASLLKKTGKVDIIWSFDLGNLYPFRLWRNTLLKIFHPVDEPLNKAALASGAGASIIFSVTHEILDKYKSLGIPSHFVNHGLSDDFLQPVDVNKGIGKPIRVGFAGNLLRPDIDREVFLQIIKENSTVIFECWGSYNTSQSNIGGGEDDSTRSFIEGLQQQKNVFLHGAIASSSLVAAFQKMDAFLICYDVQKDQSKGTNYHKVMEYLSTGKVTISNSITTYRQQPELIQMVESRENNQQLPVLFSAVISNLEKFNAPDKQHNRIQYALQNTYSQQLEKIEGYVSEL